MRYLNMEDMGPKILGAIPSNGLTDISLPSRTKDSHEHFGLGAEIQTRDNVLPCGAPQVFDIDEWTLASDDNLWDIMDLPCSYLPPLKTRRPPIVPRLNLKPVFRWRSLCERVRAKLFAPNYVITPSPILAPKKKRYVSGGQLDVETLVDFEEVWYEAWMGRHL